MPALLALASLHPGAVEAAGLAVMALGLGPLVLLVQVDPGRDAPSVRLTWVAMVLVCATFWTGCFAAVLR